jgi:ketosteroid isomerase-like protein
MLTAVILHAQKTIEGLISAEKSFAAYSVANGTKDAFLKFTDSSGIVFDNGKPVNAIETWMKREKRPIVLNWEPQFAEIASSNDFGYTTGSWALRPNANDTVVARGQYTTVWHVDGKGEWKFLVDLGVGNTPLSPAPSLKKIEVKKIKGPSSTGAVLKEEQNFIDAYKKDKSKAYTKYLSGNGLLNRNGQYSTIDKIKQSETITNTPSAIQYTIAGSGIASTGDLAYVYGNTLISDKQENYLRVWRKEKQGWKIALEVVRY